jgi:hypothetical protein
MTTNTRDSSPHWAVGFAAYDTTKSPSAVSSLREAEAAGNTSAVDVNQQLVSESPGGNSHPDDPHPEVLLPNVTPPEMRPDVTVGAE